MGFCCHSAAWSGMTRDLWMVMLAINLALTILPINVTDWVVTFFLFILISFPGLPIMQTLTSGPEVGSGVGEEQEAEEDTQGTRTTSTWGARESMIDTMERRPFLFIKQSSLKSFFFFFFLIMVYWQLFWHSLQRYLSWGKERRQRTLELGLCWGSCKVSELQINMEITTCKQYRLAYFYPCPFLWSELMELTSDAPVKSEEPQIPVDEDQNRWVTHISIFLQNDMTSPGSVADSSVKSDTWWV